MVTRQVIGEWFVLDCILILKVNQKSDLGFVNGELFGEERVK